MNIMDTRATSAMLYLDGVHVSFDGFHAINNLSLALEPGEMRAIIGPNGAGKTTMMDIITGKTKPDEGVVLFDGVTDLTRLDETRIIASRARCSGARVSPRPSVSNACWKPSA
jgi:urea transport system ATP-binding protein